MEYIGPQYQLPVLAESRIVDYLAAFQELARGIATTFRAMANAFAVAMKPVVRLIKRVAEYFYNAGLLRRPGRKHYKVAYRRHPISRKRAMIAQRKMGLG